MTVPSNLYVVIVVIGVIGVIVVIVVIVLQLLLAFYCNRFVPFYIYDAQSIEVCTCVGI